MQGLMKQTVSAARLIGALLVLNACDESKEKRKAVEQRAPQFDLSGIWVVTDSNSECWP